MLWLCAALIDSAAPAWLTRERLRGLQRMAIACFAERYGRFVIICLGQSIVAIGLGAQRQAIDAELLINRRLWPAHHDGDVVDVLRPLRGDGVGTSGRSRGPDPACGGVAIYLFGHGAVRLRLLGEVGVEKLLGAAAMMALFALAGGLRAWAVVALGAAIVGALCVYEARSAGGEPQG